jgi:hypothetical protein
MATVQDQLASRVVGALVVREGKLELPEQELLAIGKTIHEAGDDAAKSTLATALVALAVRLKEVPGAGPACEHVTALAAIAMGDVELNGALCRALYRRPG